MKTFMNGDQLKSAQTAPYVLLIPVDVQAHGFATYFVNNASTYFLKLPIPQCAYRVVEVHSDKTKKLLI
jgi:hypothetical protein